MSKPDPLLTPFTIKGLTLKNRILSTSHAISYVEDGHPKERYQLYHEEKAKGGIALTMFGGSSVISKDSPSVFSQIDISDDSIIPVLQLFSARIHQHDCALMCQITHMGRRTSDSAGDWLPTIAPSPLREMGHRAFPREMDDHDIKRVLADFAAAALRCKEGGLDGVEVIASGHLLGQFMSPLTNQRSDGYGGSTENRARFILETFDAIKKAVGADFITSIRLAINEGGDGIVLEEAARFAQIFEAAGTIDILNANHGRVDTARALAEDCMPSMGRPLAPFLRAVGQFKQATKLPVFHAARVNDLATARWAIEEGLVDMIGMTRAHIADPHIVKKLMAGEEERIRPCVGASYCLSEKRTCVHNVAIGREAKLPHTIPARTGPKRRVVIVGGGPAGMESARVSALRGHDVVLFEAQGRLGGQIRLAERAGWRKDMGAVADWLEAEVTRLPVDLRLNTWAEGPDVLAEKPDVVIIASGGLPDMDGLEGADQALSVWDALAGEPLQGRVLIYDLAGRNQGLSTADHLAGKGAKVTYVTPDPSTGMDLGYIEDLTYRKNFYENGVEVIRDREVTTIKKSGNGFTVQLINNLTDAREDHSADHVILERGTRPLDSLYHDLRAGSANDGELDVTAAAAWQAQPVLKDLKGGGENYALYRIGDAVTSRDIHAAILDGLRLCVGV